MINKKILHYCSIGDDFVKYLKDTRASIIRKRDELKEIYVQEFRTRFPAARLPSFGSVLFGMQQCRKIWREMDSIIFINWTYPKRHVRPKHPQARVADPPKQCLQVMHHHAAFSPQLHKDDLSISITCSSQDHQFEDSKLTLEVDESKKNYVLNLKVENTGKKDVCFISCACMGSSDNFTLTESNGENEINPRILTPGDSFEISVRFHCSKVECYRTKLVFSFEQDLWGSPIIMERSIVVHCDDAAGRELAPIAPYTPRSHPVYVLDGPIVDGVKPKRSPNINHRMDTKLEVYEMSNDREEYIESLRRLFYSSSTRAAPTALLDEPLSWKNFQDKFELLLNLQELQEKKDLSKFNVPNDERNGVMMQRDKARPDLLVMELPGLSENRPSVTYRDEVLVYIPGEKNIYSGYVHEVQLNSIKLGFNKELLVRFRPTMMFHVEFVLMRLLLRVEHRAVEQAGAFMKGLRPVLFPVKPPIRSDNTEPPKLSMFKRKLQENPQQVQAIEHIVAGSSKPAPYVVFGPPGTGKTVTLVEAIQQIVRKNSRCHILACAPCNRSTDLLWLGITQNVDKHNVYRLYAMNCDIQAEIKPYSNWSRDSFFLPCKEELMEHKIIVTTLFTAGRLVTRGIDKGHFTHVFVDEAGQAMEPECLIPIAGLLSAKSGQVVLAGDPKQLGPILRCQLAIKFGLGMSFLERIMKRYEEDVDVFDKRFVTKLQHNYRSHPDILKIPNEYFYNGELEYSANRMLCNSLCSWSHLPKMGFPVIFHGVNGDEEREANSPSFFNRAEVRVVRDYVKKLFETSGKKGLSIISPKNIGIIAPYRKQVQKIRQILNTLNSDLSNLKVGSVEEFQGQERKVILVTAVQSMARDENCSLGFFKNEKKFNVAMTRAQALLIVVGNTAFLKKDDLWKRFIEYCQEKGGYTGVAEDQFPHT